MYVYRRDFWTWNHKNKLPGSRYYGATKHLRCTNQPASVQEKKQVTISISSILSGGNRRYLWIFFAERIWIWMVMNSKVRFTTKRRNDSYQSKKCFWNLKVAPFITPIVVEKYQQNPKQLGLFAVFKTLMTCHDTDIHAWSIGILIMDCHPGQTM